MILRAGTVTCFGLVLRTACQGKPVEEAELPQRVDHPTGPGDNNPSHLARYEKGII
jgi:hypothetical protein